MKGITAREVATSRETSRIEQRIERLDVREAYYDWLLNLVDLDALARLDGTLLHDAMGGAACGWLSGFISYVSLPLEVLEIHAEPHPLFFGVNPEPLAYNLAVLRERMRDNHAFFGAATDGDGDRLGVILPGGGFFNSHQIFAVLLDLLSSRNGNGKVVKTFTVSRVIERLAASRGLPLVETPVGFKYIVNAMLEGSVLIGGEESGGIGVAGHIPERDGIANTLLLLEAIAKQGASLSDIFEEIEKEVSWKHAYDRLDLHLKGNALKNAVMEGLKNPPEVMAGSRVLSIEDLDGYKLNLDGDAWLLFRTSGTEPVLRVYCEASSRDRVHQILGAAEAFIQGFA